MHVTTTDFRDLAMRVTDIGQRGHFGNWRTGHSDLEAYQAGSNSVLEFPSSGHIIE